MLIKMKYNIFLMILLLSSCTNDEKKKDNLPRYYYKNNFLIKDEFWEGNIKTKYVYTKDTSIRNKIDFFSNGEIEKWSYFNNKSKYPLFISYYDSLGNYSGFKGTPFIKSGTTRKGSVVVEVVNPPNIDVFVTYKDLLENNLQHQITHEPIKTDSSLWITLDEYKYDSKHNYYLIYKFFYKNKLVDSLSTEILP